MNMYYTQSTQRGFTLLELLVVIAIIGLLASIVLASLDTARSKARDAQRISTMREVRTAMELFYTEYGRYPEAHDAGNFGQPDLDADGILAATVRSTNLRDFYPGEPRDPLGVPASEYGYATLNNGSGYAILVYYENTSSFCETGVNKNTTVFGVPNCP